MSVEWILISCGILRLCKYQITSVALSAINNLSSFTCPQCAGVCDSPSIHRHKMLHVWAVGLNIANNIIKFKSEIRKKDNDTGALVILKDKTLQHLFFMNLAVMTYLPEPRKGTITFALNRLSIFRNRCPCRCKHLQYGMCMSKRYSVSFVTQPYFQPYILLNLRFQAQMRLMDRERKTFLYAKWNS